MSHDTEHRSGEDRKLPPPQPPHMVGTGKVYKCRRGLGSRMQHHPTGPTHTDYNHESTIPS